MLEDDGRARAGAEVSGGSKGKLSKVRPGQYVAYVGAEKKKCKIGLVQDINVANQEVTVQRHLPVSDGRLRVKWKPVFWKNGSEALDVGSRRWSKYQ